MINYLLHSITTKMPILSTHTPPLVFFLKDYFAYVRMMGLRPHPHIAKFLPPGVSILDITRRLIVGMEEASPVVKNTKKNTKTKKEEQITSTPLTTGNYGKAKGSLKRPTKGSSKANREEEEDLYNEVKIELPEVSHLNFRGYQIDTGTIKALSLSIPHSQSLSSLTLWRTGLTEPSLRLLLEALKNPPLTSLTIDLNPIPLAPPPPQDRTSAIVTPSSPLLSLNSTLPRSGNPSSKPLQTPPTPVPSLSPLLSTPSQSLLSNNINNSSNNNTNSLNNNNNSNNTSFFQPPIPPPPVYSLFGTLPFLQTLSLNSNHIDDYILGTLLEGFTQHGSLTSLSLYDNDITDNGCIAIANFLRTSVPLTALSLAKNKIGDSGAMCLASILGRVPLSPEDINTRRRMRAELEVRRREIEKKRERRAAALAGKQKARRAGVNANGSPIVASSTSNTSSPTIGTLSNPLLNPISPEKSEKPIPEDPNIIAALAAIDEQLAHFLPAEEVEGKWYIDGNRTLLSLNLRSNQIGDVGVVSLCGMLQINKAIKRLSLEHNPMSEESKALWTSIENAKKLVSDEVENQKEQTVVSITTQK
eukprot:TRINITY_DN5260_c0_g1_i1.p1 TRINITY_DN5260_c0_g1~~TRINITY_DN5260_c0_g1_i1.p1  ORF type:complete len:587 (+),score=153.97 TRINITY_DN5260_c0_g1_i1:52-1812(+)